MFFDFFNNAKSFLFENKNIRQTILKNAFWLMAAETITKIVSFFALIWLARYFGPAEYGKFTFAISFAAIFAFIADFGFPTYTARELARDKSKISKYVDNILFIQIILGLVTFALVLLVSFFIKKDTETTILIYFLAISNLLNVFILFFQSVFCATEKMEYTAFSKTVQGVALFLMLIYLIVNKLTILYVGYAYLFSSILSLFVVVFFIWKNFSKIFLKIDLKFCRKVLEGAWPIAILYFSLLIFQSFDLVAIGFFRSVWEVGLYGAALKIILSTYLILSVLYSVFLPPISRAFHNKETNLKDIVEKYALSVFALGLPLAIGGFMVAEELITFLYGSQYLGSIIPFKILSFNLIFIFIVNFLGYSLIFFDKQKEFLKANLIGVFINIVLDFIFIPEFGIIGASIISVIVQLIVLVISFTYFKKVLKINFKKVIFTPMIASVFMAIALFFVQRFFDLNVLILIFIGVIVYFSIGFIFFKNNLKGFKNELQR